MKAAFPRSKASLSYLLSLFLVLATLPDSSILAEGHLNRRRFGAMLRRIALLPVPTG